MASVPNRRNTAHDCALTEGDFILVMLNVGGGFSGVVIEHTKQFLRMVAHEATRPVAIPDQPPSACLAWELLVPWSSIAWVKHSETSPDACDCLIK